MAGDEELGARGWGSKEIVRHIRVFLQYLCRRSTLNTPVQPKPSKFLQWKRRELNMRLLHDYVFWRKTKFFCQQEKPVNGGPTIDCPVILYPYVAAWLHDTGSDNLHFLRKFFVLQYIFAYLKLIMSSNNR
ncbi:hypothetical protein V1477_007186 [Vespula maculifrons]|uniref:Uncharacterized protein n=1 Tax=Vespula maculifrons TaxID=7453 RepID=A0ABD2CIV9_VESMC